MSDKYYIPYFTYREPACKATGKIVLAEGFAEKLVALRERFNKPMVITSCCRSSEYNRKVGGTINSFHIYDYPRYGLVGTCAVHVAIHDPTDKGNLIATAWQLGWSIGIHKRFVHLDRRTDYTGLKLVVFFYESR